MLCAQDRGAIKEEEREHGPDLHGMDHGETGRVRTHHRDDKHVEFGGHPR